MKLARFLLALALLSALSIVAFAVDPSLKYEMKAYPYNWIGQKIFDPHTDMRIAFVGTSRTWTAVETDTINARMPRARAYNLGANWFGRQARWIVVRDLLEQQKLERLVLEVAHEEEYDVHPYSAYLGGPLDLPTQKLRELDWRQVLGFQRPFKMVLADVIDYYACETVRGFYLWYRRLWHGSIRDQDLRNQDAAFGHHAPSVTAEAQAEFYASIKDVPAHYGAFDDSSTLFRDEYLRKISALCREKGVRLYFLFIPERNAPLPGPRFLALLRELGEPVLLDLDGLFEPELWRDAGHWNGKGTAIFTERLMASSVFDGIPSAGASTP